MMANADWRDEQRTSRVKKQRAEQAKEDDEAKREHDPQFLNRELRRAQENPREPRRAQESRGEPGRARESSGELGEPRGAQNRFRGAGREVVKEEGRHHKRLCFLLHIRALICFPC